MFLKSTLIVCATAATLGLAATTAQAVTIFSQTPNLSHAYASDQDYPLQYADNLSLTATDTARSVTWRGVFAPKNTHLVPISFDLIFYGDNGSNLPDQNDVISSTTVNFTSTADFTPTGNNLNNKYDEYEFQANLTPTLLTVGTPVWFSVLANTNNDTNDDFYWTSGGPGDVAALRNGSPLSGPFTQTTNGPFYFVLDNAPLPSTTTSAVPEPASLTLLGLGGLVMFAGNRRRR